MRNLLAAVLLPFGCFAAAAPMAPSREGDEVTALFLSKGKPR